MIFSNFSGRSSREDALDRALNEMVDSSSTNEEFTSDANEIHRWAEETLRTDPAATGPAAGTWNRVLHQVEQNSQRGNATMSSATIGYESFEAARRQVGMESMRRYANLAATMAMVIAVAFGGWFATMQLNQPGSPEPRWAIQPATPLVDQSETCDVEPLSTDRVMDIVRNPARFMATGATGEALNRVMLGGATDAELMEADPDLKTVGESSMPTQDQFDEASEFANEYLSCLVHGTQAQIWTFYSPVHLQQKILREFPVFAEESLVRERVEEMSTQPAYYGELQWEVRLAVVSPWLREDDADDSSRSLDPEIGLVTVNSELELSRVHQSESSYYTHVLSIGIEIQDQDGEQILLTNGLGYRISPVTDVSGANAPIIYIQIAKLRGGDGWVIIPWPSESELDWYLYE